MRSGSLRSDCVDIQNPSRRESKEQGDTVRRDAFRPTVHVLQYSAISDPMPCDWLGESRAAADATPFQDQWHTLWVRLANMRLTLVSVAHSQPLIPTRDRRFSRKSSNS